MKLLIRGDARRIPLANGSVQCCATSPPYWGLRDYGVPGQLGLEPTPEEYVANMVEVFREVRRVLRDDGTLWLNLGDSYAAGAGGRGDGTSGRPSQKHDGQRIKRELGAGLKPKDLVGIPWRVAFALQANGWYLRSDIIWSKPNPMPESVTDRPTKAHEYVFLLSKRATYFYDAEAVKECAVKGASGSRFDSGKTGARDGGNRTQPGYRDNAGRNRRTVWHIATQPYSGAHFATMPEALVEPCVLAGTSQRGACVACGAPWERVVDKETIEPADHVCPKSIGHAGRGSKSSGLHEPGWRKRRPASIAMAGWRPTCTCIDDALAGGCRDKTHMDALSEPVPCVVLDPFAGSGTVVKVARKLRRTGIGIDISDTYLRENAKARTGSVQAEFR